MDPPFACRLRIPTSFFFCLQIGEKRAVSECPLQDDVLTERLPVVKHLRRIIQACLSSQERCIMYETRF